jgi:hypothetical protein
MDTATVIVAGLGIAGTVAAAAISPLVTARQTRRGQRARTYGEALSALWTISDRAVWLAATPGAQVEQPPFDRLRHVGAEARLLGGENVRKKLRVATELANAFEAITASSEWPTIFGVPYSADAHRTTRPNDRVSIRPGGADQAPMVRCRGRTQECAN